MKKSLLLLVFLISSQLLFAQSDSSKWSVGIYVSPDYAFRTISQNIPVMFSDLYINSRNYIEKPMLGITAGITVDRNISRHFSIASGIYFKNKGYQWDLSKLTFGDEIDPRFGYTFATTQATYSWTSAKHRLHAVCTFDSRFPPSGEDVRLN